MLANRGPLTLRTQVVTVDQLAQVMSQRTARLICGRHGPTIALRDKNDEWRLVCCNRHVAKVIYTLVPDPTPGEAA